MSEAVISVFYLDSHAQRSIALVLVQSGFCPCVGVPTHVHFFSLSALVSFFFHSVAFLFSISVLVAPVHCNGGVDKCVQGTKICHSIFTRNKRMRNQNRGFAFTASFEQTSYQHICTVIFHTYTHAARPNSNRVIVYVWVFF